MHGGGPKDVSRVSPEGSNFAEKCGLVLVSSSDTHNALDLEVRALERVP